MHHKQMPEAENNGNGKNFITWKIVVLAVCLPLIGALGSRLWDSTSAANEKSIAVIHKRIDALNAEKVDKSVLEQCLKRIDEKLDLVVDDLKSLKRMHQKQ